MVVTRYDIFAELRVEHSDFLHGNLEHIGYLLEVDTLRHLYGIGDKRVFDQCGLDAVTVVIIHHIVCGDECGEIAAGFGEKIVVNFPEVFFASAGTAQGFVNIAGAAVVGSDGKRPVTVYSVELLEVFHGVVRGQARVAALVHERIHLKAEIKGRSRHELPETHGPGARYGVGVDGAFYHRQILKLQRHFLLHELFHEYAAVIVVKGEHVAHKVAALAQIHVDELAYNLVVGHLYLGGEAGEEVFVFGCIADVAGAVGGCFYGEVFKVIVFAELASLGLEAFGGHHIIVGDGVLYVEYRRPRMQG